MDLIHRFLNLVAPPATFFTLLFFVPPLYFFKCFLSFVSSVFYEDVTGKVVLITGASSGIGEHLAYEYAKRGACLSICARREHRLRYVAERALELGATDVIAVRADVSNVNDCKLLVDETLDRFGRLDHLVNNAGINQVCLLEEADDITDYRPVMVIRALPSSQDINFWGSVYTTRFAAPHLRNSKGKIIALSSVVSWLPVPRMSLYNASKAAVMQFFETLRVEFAPDVKITIVTPGLVESELTRGKYLTKGGKLVLDPEMRDVQVGIGPVATTDYCAKAIVDGVCRGDRYVTVPAWFRVTYLWRVFWPEVIDWTYRLLFNPRPGASPEEALSKRLLDLTGAQKILYPETLQIPAEQKGD
ncbi:unnamed protein product [Ilex paraguariensis]|uniref:11-beta-hydroxysteroid dehydrogenase 1B n=1 Tax=Ilex paraguariensis TaxID=185542 RepID=A0ABC8QZW7_9AQUA